MSVPFDGIVDVVICSVFIKLRLRCRRPRTGDDTGARIQNGALRDPAGSSRNGTALEREYFQDFEQVRSD